MNIKIYDPNKVAIKPFSIKLNGHILTDDTLIHMKDLMMKSVKTGNEMGFALCADKYNNLHARTLCIGNNCNVEIKNKCNEDETFAGSYHTHPHGGSAASASDLCHCGLDHNICISGVYDNKIRCYIWKHKPITEEKFDELKMLYDKGIRKIDDPTYKKNFECIKDMTPLDRIHVMIRKDTLESKDIEKIASELYTKTREFEKKYYKEKIL